MNELLFLRMKLLNNKFDKEDEILFKDLLSTLESSKKNNYKLFILSILHLAQNELDKQNYIEAGRDINFVHNIPTTHKKEFNEEYFFNVELLSYLEFLSESNKTKKIKQVITLVSKYFVESPLSKI